jgi:dihydropteroate synthase
MINKTKIVGILNITPDSFSDGGKYTDEQAIVNHTKNLIDEGADIIDVGAESTRPGAEKLSDEEEWQRLSHILSKIIQICHTYNVQVSLDTYHPNTAKKAVKLGVDYINDVDGLNNQKMVDTVKKSDVKLIVMHSLTVPADKQININEDLDVIIEIKNWAYDKIQNLVSMGIDKSRIIFDPGIGFNKTANQSMELIQRVNEFKDLQIPIYIGHSRKSFLGDIKKRDERTLEISKQLIKQEIEYIRVHDVNSHQDITF